MSLRDHFVYRLFASDGELLYVGATCQPRVRRAQHAATQPWWQDVASWRMAGPYPKGDAYRIEAQAIVDELPRYNRMRPIFTTPPSEPASPSVGGLVTTADAAKMLGVTVSTVNRMAVAKVLAPAAKVDGKRGARLYAEADVLALLERRRSEAS